MGIAIPLGLGTASSIGRRTSAARTADPRAAHSRVGILPSLLALLGIALKDIRDGSTVGNRVGKVCYGFIPRLLDLHRLKMSNAESEII